MIAMREVIISVLSTPNATGKLKVTQGLFVTPRARRRPNSKITRKISLPRATRPRLKREVARRKMAEINVAHTATAM